MRSKSDHAWRMAAECAKLAQGADEKDEREFYVRMRDSWITVANRYEFLNAVGEPAGGPRPVMPGLDPGIHRKEALQSKRICRVISAFTRVFRRAMPGNDGTASYHTASR